MNNLFLKIKLASIAGLGILALVACHPKSTVYSDPMDQNKTWSKTYGQTEKGDYQELLRHDGNGRVINSPTAPSNQTYYFNFDQASISEKTKRFILIQARYLASHPKAKIRLEGNTDDRGSREYNVGLGWRRDKAVYSLLSAQGVLHKQIEMVSFGKEKPALRALKIEDEIALARKEQALSSLPISQKIDLARSLNRRVDLFYITRGS